MASQPQVFFTQTQRGLPTLNRGWRTPDPSPTRDAAGLPGYQWTLCVSDSFEENEASACRRSKTQSTSKPQGEEPSACWTSRTPSPSPTRYPVYADKDHGPVYAKNDPGQFVTRSLMVLPVMSANTEEPDRGQFATRSLMLLPVMFDTSDEQEALTPRMTGMCAPRGNSNVKASSPATQQKLFNTPIRSAGIKDDAKTIQIHSLLQGLFSQCEAEEVKTSGGPDISGVSPTLSKGSLGHPFTCGAPCKYAWKKNRGCKDGPECSRCHLCEWRRRNSDRGKGHVADSMEKLGKQLSSSSEKSEMQLFQ